jgi:hypothetical protein
MSSGIKVIKNKEIEKALADLIKIQSRLDAKFTIAEANFLEASQEKEKLRLTLVEVNESLEALRKLVEEGEDEDDPPA